MASTETTSFSVFVISIVLRWALFPAINTKEIFWTAFPGALLGAIFLHICGSQNNDLLQWDVKEQEC